jgi:hypothetical protein
MQRRRKNRLFVLKLVTSFLLFECLAFDGLDDAAAAPPDFPSLSESELSINSFDLGIFCF